MLRVWNVVLVTGAFALSLFGTFLTRSGVISSIHSFTQSSIGAWFLGFIAVVIAASITLILVRLPLLRSPTRMESLVSREAAFLYNNLFLVALALTVLWGVVFPLVSEAVRGFAVTIGAPYYDFFAIAFGLPLVLLMGIGPLVAWRRASLRALGTSLLWPTGVALVTGATLLAAGAGSSPAGLVGYTFASFVLGAIVLEFARGTRARRSLGDQGWLGAFAGLVGRNRRRYGGYVVHAAIVLLLIGAVGIGGFGTEQRAKLAPGQSLRVGSYDLAYLGSSQQRGANAVEMRGSFDVSRGGKELGPVSAGKNSYLAEQQVSNEVAIRSDWLRGEDLFVIVDKFTTDGGVRVKVLVNPLVNLIWLAGLVFVLGSLITMWPDAREQRRLARRFAYAPA
jgi:cytochrome c-type biogenesis protein CcmF